MALIGCTTPGAPRPQAPGAAADDDGSLSWAELAEACNQRHAKCHKMDSSKAAAGPDGPGTGQDPGRLTALIIDYEPK